MEVIRLRQIKGKIFKNKLHVDQERFKEQRNLVQKKKNKKTNFVKNQIQKTPKNLRNCGKLYKKLAYLLSSPNIKKMS